VCTKLLDDGLLAARRPQGHWSDYPAGVLRSLREHGVPVDNGFSMTTGNVPLEPDSARRPVEVATALAVLGTTSLDLPPDQDRAALPRAEKRLRRRKLRHMDQFVSCCGQQDHASDRLPLVEYQLLPSPDRAPSSSQLHGAHTVAGGEGTTPPRGD